MVRLSVAIATEHAAPNAFVVWRGIESSVKKAKCYGYDGVELALSTANQLNDGDLAELLRCNDLVCPCISTGQVFTIFGLSFTTPDKTKQIEVTRVFKGLIDLASRLGAMVNIGRVRGFVEKNETRQVAIQRFVEVARDLADYALPRHVTLLLEPINRYEVNFVNSLAEGAALIEQVGRPNMKLMPDLFHMNIEEPTIGGELERFAPHIGYIHVADSNRLAPGQGHTDFAAFFASLNRMNYGGWLSVEILPKPDPDTAARQAAEFLRPKIDAYNKERYPNADCSA